MEILPILDSMELALKVESEDEAIKNYVKGFEMIHKQLVGVLENEGVKPIEALKDRILRPALVKVSE